MPPCVPVSVRLGFRIQGLGFWQLCPPVSQSVPSPPPARSPHRISRSDPPFYLPVCSPGLISRSDHLGARGWSTTHHTPTPLPPHTPRPTTHHRPSPTAPPPAAPHPTRPGPPPPFPAPPPPTHAAPHAMGGGYATWHWKATLECPCLRVSSLVFRVRGSGTRVLGLGFRGLGYWV